MTTYATIPLRVQDQGGRAIPSATVVVRLFNQATLATLYDPDDGAPTPATISQPLLTDGDGYCFFALPEGVRVDIEVSGPGLASKIFPGIMAAVAGAGGGGTWGSITGTLANQTDLQAALNALSAADAALSSAKADKTVTITGAGLISGGGDLSANRQITTSMNTGKLVGRSTAGVGVMEEISIGANLSLVGGVLSATAAATPGADLFNYMNFF